MVDSDSVNVSALRADLQDFAQRANALIERGDVRYPWTTLRILGRHNRERMWQRYLRYFLDPSRPHGFDGRFLEATLKQFAEKSGFDIDLLHPDLERIDIEIEAEGDEGRPDLILSHEDRWFVCIEMKVDAGYDKDQLNRYLNASQFGEITVSNYSPENRFYVFIDKERPSNFGSNSVGESTFKLVTWADLVEVMDTVLAPPSSHYSSRSLEQLRDFRSVIAAKTNMNDDETYRELKNEFVKHRGAIYAADEAGEEFVARHLAHDWVNAISEGGDYQPSFWNENWAIRYRESNDSPGWGQIYRTNWKQDDPDIDVHFEHKPKWKYFRDGELRFTLEIEGRSEANQQIKDCWNHHRDSIKERAPDTVEILKPSTRNKYMLESTDGAYDYIAGDPDAYFEALQSAIEDNTGIAEVIDSFVDSLPIEDVTNVKI